MQINRLRKSQSFKMLVHKYNFLLILKKNKCIFLTILLQQKLALVMSFQ